MKNSTYWLIVILLLAVIVVGGGVLAHSCFSEEAPEATAQTTTEAQSENAAPDFTVFDAEGNEYRLSDFQGKPVVLNFWASWCGPCKAEMPDFNEIYQEYGDAVQFMMVNLTDGSNETVETASALIEQMGYVFPVYYDTAMEAAAAYQVYSIPMTCMIDENGDLLDIHIGTMSGDELEQGIQTLLSE